MKITPVTAWLLARETLQSWSDDYASSMGAALAYYTMFSIAPLLLIVISVAGLFFGEQAARGEILDQLEGLMGADGARAVQSLLASVNHPKAGILATLFGLGALVVGATTVIGELQNSLDRIWRAPQRDTHTTIATSDAAAPNVEATALRPMYSPMAILPIVNSSAVTTAPMPTSRHSMRTRGISL